MSVLDFFGKRDSESETGGAGEKEGKKPNVPNANLPGQGELIMSQGSVTQQSGFQDFQCLIAPFCAEKEAFPGN